MRHHSTAPALPKILLAALMSVLPFQSLANASEFAGRSKPSLRTGHTDRLTIKYRGAPQPGDGNAGAGTARPTPLARAGARSGASLTHLHRTALGADVVHLGGKLTVAEVTQLAKEIQDSDPNVEYAEPDRMMVTMAPPNDPAIGNNGTTSTQPAGCAPKVPGMRRPVLACMLPSSTRVIARTLT